MIKNLTVSLIVLILSCNHSISQEIASQGHNPYKLSRKEVQWMHQATLQQLKGCRVKGTNGLWLHTPDGVGNYKALWTRDFYYMVEYAGDLMDPAEIRATIHYLINGQREDGCMPDRVNIDGKPVYSPGPDNNPMADHALDNGPFMALLVCSYANQFKDGALFRSVEEKLRKGLDFINRSASGLVYNDPENAQCVYGFTDTVKKTGNLLFSSLLYYKACKEMAVLCRTYDFGDPEIYKVRAENIKKNMYTLLDEKSGMFWAADKDCKQIDIWGSAYAVSIGITNGEQSERISDYLIRNADQIFMNGQIRHLPGSDAGWHNLFVPIAKGTYQNGAYWATPLAWVVPVIAQQNKPLAKKILQDVIVDFQHNGINECINSDYKNIPNYVASATNVYGLTR
ncbi:hypothetical protein [uncultured Kriegella sp.]|uniref:hypothetical protein n=1 Tax=uncultured Kriegella sp. TaxID=1798910 RepID=UPI0030D73794|tara:strand:+ start:127642 stop:128832 length:1191 start_codon:yes stop_codon:yes gene_type:complete